MCRGREKRCQNEGKNATSDVDDGPDKNLLEMAQMLLLNGGRECSAPLWCSAVEAAAVADGDDLQAADGLPDHDEVDHAQTGVRDVGWFEGGKYCNVNSLVVLFFFLLCSVNE